MQETQRNRLLRVSSSQAGLLDLSRVRVSCENSRTSAVYLLTYVLEFFLANQAPVYELAFRMLSKSHKYFSLLYGGAVYWQAMSWPVGCYALMIIIPILQYMWYRHENNRRDRELALAAGDEIQASTLEFSDETDFERWQTFRYTL